MGGGEDRLSSSTVCSTERVRNQGTGTGSHMATFSGCIGPRIVSDWSELSSENEILVPNSRRYDRSIGGSARIVGCAGKIRFKPEFLLVFFVHQNG